MEGNESQSAAAPLLAVCCVGRSFVPLGASRADFSKACHVPADPARPHQKEKKQFWDTGGRRSGVLVLSVRGRQGGKQQATILSVRLCLLVLLLFAAEGADPAGHTSGSFLEDDAPLRRAGPASSRPGCEKGSIPDTREAGGRGRACQSTPAPCSGQFSLLNGTQVFFLSCAGRAGNRRGEANGG